MTTVNTYLTFKGNCEEAFNFYKSAFGGEFEFLSRYTDMPKDDSNFRVNKCDLNNIMHVSLPIGNTVLMGSDADCEWEKGLVVGSNFSVSINTDSKEEADRLFELLSANGKITMPMNKTFWDSYFGMLTDKFNIQWMISFYDKAKQK